MPIEQVSARIQHDIELGLYLPGRPLPAVSALAIRYGASRRIVRRALEELARVGLVASRPGSGWHIVRTLRTADPSPQRSLTRWAEQQGYPSSVEIVSVGWTRPNHEEQVLLRRDDGVPLLQVVRVRSIGPVDLCLERSLYAPELVDLAPESDLTRLAEAAEDRRDAVVLNRQHTIDAIAASTEDARLLGVRRGGPILRVRRQSLGPENEVLELGEDHYPPGIIAFRAQGAPEPRRQVS